MNPPEDDELPQGRNEEAADWCMRMADGNFSPDCQRRFDLWLAEPGSRLAFEEAITVWRGIDHASDKAEFIHLRAGALEGFREANGRRWTKGVFSGWRRQMGAAAALFLVAALTIFMLLRDPVEIYETGIGERRIAMLSDGSRLSLDAATRIEVRLRNDRRDLKLLAGRAKFDVAKDPFRPFIVAVGGRIVVATGTAFSVELLAKDTRVILYEGKVDVLQQADRGKAVPGSLGPGAAGSKTLTPGQEMIASNSAPSAVIVSTDVPRALSWETGQLSFEDEPLLSAVERVNRYSATNLVVGDEETAKLRVSGIFTTGDTDAFLEAVTAFAPILVRREGAHISLQSPREKKKIHETAVPTTT